MSNQTRFIKSERRAFLKGAAVVGGVAAVAPATTMASDEQPVVIDEDDLMPKGYEENEYIRKYYDRARF